MPIRRYYSDSIDVPKSSWRDSGTYQCFVDAEVTIVSATDVKVSISNVGLEQETYFSYNGAPGMIELLKFSALNGPEVGVNKSYHGSGGTTGYVLVSKKVSNYEFIYSRIPGQTTPVVFSIADGWWVDGGFSENSTFTAEVSNFMADLPAYKINFNSVRGSNIPSQGTKYQSVPYTIPDQIPVDPDYTFQGWDTQSAAATVVYRPGDIYEENEQLTLYAVWLKNIDISFSGTALQCERVNENGNSDDASTYVKVSSILDVNSVWATETHLSIEAMEADVQVQTEPIRHAVTIKPAVDIPKAEDTYSSRHNITWKSYDDQIEFTADKSYDVTMKAEVYKIEHFQITGETLELEPLAPASISAEDEAISKSIDLPSDVNPDIATFQIITRDQDPWWLYADSKISIENGQITAEYSYPENTHIPAEIPCNAVTVTYFITKCDEESGMCSAINDSKTLIFDDIPDSMQYGDEPISYSIQMDTIISRIKEENNLTLTRSDITSIRPFGKHGSGLMYGLNSASDSMTQDEETGDITFTFTYPTDPPSRALVSNQVSVTQPDSIRKTLMVTTTKSGTILDAEFVMDFHESGKGMVIGGIAPSEGLLVGWDTEVDANLRVNGETSLGSPFSVTRVEQEEIEGQPVDVDIPIFEVDTVSQEGKVMSHIPTEVNSTLKVNGASTLSSDVSVGGNVLISSYTRSIRREGYPVSWADGKVGALVQATTCTNTVSFWPVVSAKSYTGSWTMGTLSDSLAFAYVKDGGDLTRRFQIDLGESYEGIATNSGYFRSPSNGIIANTVGGSDLGTASWPWRNVSANGYLKKGVTIWMPTAWPRAAVSSGNVAAGSNITRTTTVSVPSGTTQVFPVVESPPANLMVHGITATISGTTVTVRVLFKNNLSKTVSGTCYVRVMAYV